MSFAHQFSSEGLLWGRAIEAECEGNEIKESIWSIQTQMPFFPSFFLRTLKTRPLLFLNLWENLRIILKLNLLVWERNGIIAGLKYFYRNIVTWFSQIICRWIFFQLFTVRRKPFLSVETLWSKYNNRVYFILLLGVRGLQFNKKYQTVLPVSKFGFAFFPYPVKSLYCCVFVP